MDKEDLRISQISISSNSSILEGLKKMDVTNKRLLLVFKESVFLNVLSIGDIQRAIIRNQSLETPIYHVIRKETRLAYQNETIDAIKKRMMEFRIECMPVINEKKELIRVYFWEDLFPSHKKNVNHNLNLPVVIMAGGQGSRLKPLTNILPKPLLPIGEKTILEQIMDRFSKIGCNRFHLSVNYKAEMIEHYFNEINHPNYNISYIKENKPLGTAGSLYLLQDRIDRTFFISNCDIMINEDYNEIYKYHVENNNELTIVAALKHISIPYGTIETAADGVLKSLIEKPELTYKINSGMYILEPHLLKEIPNSTFMHITELIEKIKNRSGKVGVFPISEKSWIDIGTWEEYNIILNA